MSSGRRYAQRARGGAHAQTSHAGEIIVGDVPARSSEAAAFAPNTIETEPEPFGDAWNPR